MGWRPLLYYLSPSIIDSTMDLQQLKRDMELLDKQFYAADKQMRETLYLLEVDRIKQYVNMVDQTRKLHKVNDGYNSEQIALALDKAYSTYGLAKLGMKESQWFAQCYVESRFNCKAVSKAGAIGLCQLLPSTAKSLNEDYFRIANYTDTMLITPETNAAFGALYMSILIKEYKDVGRALEAYNKGPNSSGKTDYQDSVSRAMKNHFTGR